MYINLFCKIGFVLIRIRSQGQIPLRILKLRLSKLSALFIEKAEIYHPPPPLKTGKNNVDFNCTYFRSRKHINNAVPPSLTFKSLNYVI